MSFSSVVRVKTIFYCTKFATKWQQHVENMGSAHRVGGQAESQRQPLAAQFLNPLPCELDELPRLRRSHIVAVLLKG